MLPSHLCSHSLYITTDQLFAWGIIVKTKTRKLFFLILFFVLFCLASKCTPASLWFPCAVLTWGKLKVNNFTVVCVERNLLGFGSINILYWVKKKKKKTNQWVTHLGAPRHLIEMWVLCMNKLSPQNQFRHIMM